MRLIFDTINGVGIGLLTVKLYVTTPTSLPDFLVPSSKAHLVAAREGLRQGGEHFEQLDLEEIEDRVRFTASIDNIVGIWRDRLVHISGG